MLADARAEADQLRTTARTLLADARAEVDALARRRTAITAELGQLSGVIEALAVPETTGSLPSAGPDPVPAEGDADSRPTDVRPEGATQPGQGSGGTVAGTFPPMTPTRPPTTPS